MDKVVQEVLNVEGGDLRKVCVEKVAEGKAKSAVIVVLGAYTHGGVQGLTRSSKVFPWATRLIVLRQPRVLHCDAVPEYVVVRAP